MATISKTDLLIQAIQTHALPRPGAAPGMPRTPMAKQKGTLGGRASVEQFVLERIRGIDINDARRRRRTFRAFLEGSLLDLFGPAALGDPSFAASLDQIEATFEADDALYRAMERTIDVLLAAAARDEAGSPPIANAFAR